MRGGRVDGVGVVAAVDVVEDVLMGSAEELEHRVGGDVAVGTDVGVLNDAVPEVAVDRRAVAQLESHVIKPRPAGGPQLRIGNDGECVCPRAIEPRESLCDFPSLITHLGDKLDAGGAVAQVP